MKDNRAQAFSTRSIRSRLFRLLLRAFAIVVFITLLFVIAGTLFAVSYTSKNNSFARIPLVSRLETYYLTTGNWDHVTEVLSNIETEEQKIWESAILLNEDGQMVVKNAAAVSPPQNFEPTKNNILIPITIEGNTAGSLVYPPGFSFSRFIFAGRALLPVFLISIFLAILTIIIGLFLTRRVVNPLAEVIAAAQSVSKGHLETRVNPDGPDVLRALSDSFNHMAANLERNEQERRDMLADIAHELRTPLTVLRGRLEGILDGIYQADEKHIGLALESTYLLERLVEDLRILTLAESRQYQFDLKETNLYQLCERAVELFSAQAAEKNISLSVQTNHPSLTAILDPQRFEQVISNLINNALQFVPQDGKVSINIQPDKNKIQLTINDNGPGTDPADLPFIFNRFWRKEKSRSRINGGTGLGLAISKQLIKAQNGEIWAELNDQGGLTIVIRI